MSNWQKLKAKLDVAANGSTVTKPSTLNTSSKSASTNGHASLKRKRSSAEEGDSSSRPQSATAVNASRRRHAHDVELKRPSKVSSKPQSTTIASPKKKQHVKSTSTSVEDVAEANTPNSDATGPVLTSTQPLENAVPVDSRDRAAKIGKYLALDCEMVGAVDPANSRREISTLARVSLTNYHGHVVYDTYVSPEPGVVIRDYRTWVSGIQPRHLYKAPSFSSVQSKVRELLSGRILIGHALGNDFKALSYKHPRHLVRDTSLFPAFKRYGTGKTPPLKLVAAAELELDIQGASHSSVEDARACMLLYRKYKGEFESGAKKVVL